MSASGLTFFAAALYWTLTALYGALASQAFVQEQFLAPRLFAPLARFADWHLHLGLLVLVAWIAPRWKTPERTRTTRVAAAASIWVLSNAGLALRAPLTDLKTTSSALLVVGAGVVCLLAIAAAEVRSLSAALRRPASDRSGADLAACLLAAAGLVVVDLTSTAWAGSMSAALPGTALESVRLHLLLAGAAFLTLAALRGAAALSPWPAAAESVLSTAVLAAAISSYLFSVVLHSISIGGRTGMAIALGIGISLACALVARATTSRAAADDGVVTAIRTLAPGMTSRWWGFGLWIVALAVLAAGVSAASRQADWNFVFLHSGVASTWLLALAGALVLSARFASGGARLSFAAAALLLGAHVLMRSAGVPLQASPQGASATWLAAALDGRPQSTGVSDFVRLLLEQTNIPRDVRVDPIDVTVASLEGPPAAVRPHVFVFVVDSLRRDYVSPYNPAVTFTPAIAELASDSLVFRNAFTQYGATGLSVPALWVGGPVLHKQYVMPFAPMNSLAKLLAHEGYTQWIGMDNIMEAILPASTDRRPLDQGVAIKDFRACRTLDEIRGRLMARAADAPPVFAWALPQDIHISAITREGATPVDGRDYGRFYAPVASRIARLDACLGSFLHDLKTSGLYDESIVVLTADHGDSLGEEGRMGHAYSLHPEIVRVPLIVHLPAALRASWAWDEARATYTTDVTPTLYRLLGHEVHAPAPFFGESLARPLNAPPAPSRDRMVAASYGAVYGALLDGGTRYYVFDAINMRELAFALGSGAEPGAAIPLTPGIQTRGMKVIRGTVEAIGSFYRFAPGHAADD